ncbi:hypothetical protein CKALI_00350 [Corynebacterium kalinowskii]|uniref:Uncharacterized protein n=1 Tax=Corynebacterium kalinowskii TaxID=2675216 RepID=A0A6B8VMM5_9CORY|nr:hypothetical protein [Corynebacterium kalinowskii]QGU00971.1 hypothetical protein CKALI_00350 [Corynebacterium kalinowskii]
MAEMIEIPAALYGRGTARVVPVDSTVRLDVKISAPLMRKLMIESNCSGVPLTKIVDRLLRAAISQDSEQEEFHTR